MTPPKLGYGGQAVIEGVMMRGKKTIGLACRQPDGGIYRYREPLSSLLLTSPIARVPFIRGLVVLWDSLSYGMRMLMKSAEVQTPGEKQSGTSNAIAMGIAAVIALVVFVGIPYGATQLLRSAVPSTTALNIGEGALRLVFFLAYLGGISLMPEIRRVFAYHGAEHMTIHAFEHGDPLTVDRIAPYPTAHPRCGTAFLLFVIVVSIVLFAFVPRVNLIVDLASRIALVVPVAMISYEILKLGAAYERYPAMKALVAPGLLLQRITTRRPDNGMIEVAVASLEETLAGDADG
jgi:uncharacterized protein YqhQ